MKFANLIRSISSSKAKCSGIKNHEKRQLFLEEGIKVKEPISVFREWLNEAINTKCVEPTTSHLGTVKKDGTPAIRPMLLKEVTDEGFCFCTNYDSNKALEIVSNPNVAMTFYWSQLRRSIRVEGVAEKVSHELSLRYFQEMPRSSQIGAVVIPQSTPIPSREHLDALGAEIKGYLGENGKVPMPHFGGYLLRPRLVEFWQGQSGQLNDRIRFRKGEGVEQEVDGKLVHKGENGWVYERLAP